MIINSVSAENVLKYSRLELDDIPERGIIAVSGPNESGKSTIGETVCFALFGRTFSVGPEDITKVIRWGEVECSARLTFTASDGKKYEIVRFLDSDANHSARINPAGEPDNPVARGVEAVRVKLYELIGFDYDHFIDSFYLAQREITTPHAHSYTVKTMAGIAPLERCKGVFEDEMETEEAGIVETEAQAVEFEQELAELEIDEALLPSLEAKRAQIDRQEVEETTRMEDLDAASTDYQENIGQLWAAKSKRGTAGFLRALMFLLALVSGGVWAALTQMPDSGAAESIRGLLSGSGEWNEAYAMYFLYAAIAFAVLFILFWVRKSSKNNLVATHESAASRLIGELDAIPALHQPDVGSDEEAGDESAEERAEPTWQSDGSASSGGAKRPDPLKISALRNRVASLAAPADEVKATTDQEIGWIRDQVRALRDQGMDVDAKIQAEKARLEKAAQLRDICEGLADKIAGQRRRVAQRELASDLLDGASKYISKRFNQDLRGLVGNTLPLLTEGRYEHLQIDEDLTVRAFSTQKRDFMELDEISSGTQRQIMLSVRLALAQELINRTVNADQFLFLDEPFAFFDEKRTRSALSVLPGLSDEIAQTWIIAQQFPEDMQFDMTIECSREYESLPPGLQG